MKEDKERLEIYELAFDLLEIGYFDFQVLNRYVRAGRKFNYDFIEDIKEQYRDLGYYELKQDENIKQTNGFIYCAIDRLFYLICEELEKEGDEELNKKIGRLKDSFDPFINACDSWFNNCFDDLNFDYSKEEILEQAKRLINKEENEGNQ